MPKRSGCLSTPTSGPIHKQAVPGGKERWVLSTSGESEASELFCSEVSLQDGGVNDDQGSVATEGLDVHPGFERRVPVSVSFPRRQEVSAFYMGWQDVPVHLPPVWTMQCSPHFYKTPSPSYGTLAETRDTFHYIPGRHTIHAPDQRGFAPSGRVGSPVTGIPGLHHQQGKIPTDPVSEDPILGNPSELPRDEILSSRGKSHGYHTEMSRCPISESAVSPTPITAPRQISSSFPGSFISSNSLPSTPTSKDTVVQKVEVIRHTGDSESDGKRGAAVVEGSAEVVQWKGYRSSSPKHGDRDGCLHSRMGSGVPRYKDGRTLVTTRARPTYQCTGAKGSYVSGADVCKRQYQETIAYPSENGQCVSFDLCQSNGGNPLPNLDEGSVCALGLVSPTGNYPVSLSPARSQQLDCRPGVEGDTDISRVEASQRNVSQGVQHHGPMQCGPVCQPPEPPTGRVHQLEAGPRGDGHRCISVELEGPERICFSTLRTNWKMSAEGKGGAKHFNTNSPNLAKPTMVCDLVGNADRVPSSSSMSQGLVDGPGGPTTPTSEPKQIKTSRLKGIRRQHSAAGVSAQTSELLLAGWSRGTNTAYESGWKRWSGWCEERKVNPLSAGIQQFLNFLTSLFQEGLQYRTINSIRSAVSSTHNPLEGNPIGQHPLVKQLLRGTYNSRPPQPRYVHTWDVDVVLEHIKELGENKNLSLKTLSCKLVVLMALTSANRVSEIHALDLRFRYYKSDGVLFKLASLTKKRQLGSSLKECFFSSFGEDNRLCVVQCLKQYESMTEGWRKVDADKPAPLFLSYIKPHRPVTSQRLAHWVKDLLKEAGVDTEIFKAHSVRGASTSAALKRGLHIKDILDTANWSQESTFRKFYCRSLQDNSFAKKVLSNKEALSS